MKATQYNNKMNTAEYVDAEVVKPLQCENVMCKLDTGIEMELRYLHDDVFVNVYGMDIPGSKIVQWKRIENQIRALSWKEPYGTLMKWGKVETRTWPTKYRGLVLLCTSKRGFSKNEIISISGKRQLHRIEGILQEEESAAPGTAFAIGYLINSRPMEKTDEHETYVKFKKGLYCHTYAWIKEIEPFEWPGYQRWKILTIPEVEKIKVINDE